MTDRTLYAHPAHGGALQLTRDPEGWSFVAVIFDGRRVGDTFDYCDGWKTETYRVIRVGEGRGR